MRVGFVLCTYRVHIFSCILFGIGKHCRTLTERAEWISSLVAATDMMMSACAHGNHYSATRRVSQVEMSSAFLLEPNSLMHSLLRIFCVQCTLLRRRRHVGAAGAANDDDDVAFVPSRSRGETRRVNRNVTNVCVCFFLS